MQKNITPSRVHKRRPIESNVAGKTKKSTDSAAAAFANVPASNTEIPKTHNENHVVEVFASELSHNKFGNSRRETQAQKLLEKETYESWFHD